MQPAGTHVLTPVIEQQLPPFALPNSSVLSDHTDIGRPLRVVPRCLKQVHDFTQINVIKRRSSGALRTESGFDATLLVKHYPTLSSTRKRKKFSLVAGLLCGALSPQLFCAKCTPV